MDHDLELIIPNAGNIWKCVFYNFLVSWKYWKSSVFYFLLSWKYWKLKSSTFSIVLEILDIIFSYFLISWKYWKSFFPIFSYPGNTGGGRAESGGRLQGLCCAALDYFWNMFLEKRAW